MPGPFALPMDRVGSDHGFGALLAVRHLAELGHRRIALAAHHSPTGAAVRAGYRSALGALALGAPPVPVINTFSLRTNLSGFDMAASRLLAAIREHAVTAALIRNDVDAIRLLQRLRAAGVQVPEEFSIVAYDDEAAGTADPPFTAIQPPKREIGLTAADVARPARGPARRLVAVVAGGSVAPATNPRLVLARRPVAAGRGSPPWRPRRPAPRRRCPAAVRC